MTHPGGRPTKYTEELADAIIDAISTTPMGTKKICEKFDIDVATVFRWVANNEQFCARYDNAKEKQLKLIAEEIPDIIDNESRDILPDGRLNSVAVARDKLRVDGRRYMIELLKPHKKKDEDKDRELKESCGVIAAGIAEAMKANKKDC